MNNEKNTLTLNIEIDNHCYRCNGDCDSCPYYMDETTPDEIESEANAFRLSIGIDMRKHSEVKINL